VIEIPAGTYDHITSAFQECIATVQAAALNGVRSPPPPLSCASGPAPARIASLHLTSSLSRALSSPLPRHRTKRSNSQRALTRSRP
jgi:hypothetical protein